MSKTHGSAAAAIAVPESAGNFSSSALAGRFRRDYESARAASLAAADALRALPSDASPLDVAAAADALVAAAGVLWMHAHRLAEVASP
jgi:hypothetical protein